MNLRFVNNKLKGIFKEPVVTESYSGICLKRLKKTVKSLRPIIIIDTILQFQRVTDTALWINGKFNTGKKVEGNNLLRWILRNRPWGWEEDVGGSGQRPVTAFNVNSEFSRTT